MPSSPRVHRCAAANGSTRVVAPIRAAKVALRADADKASAKVGAIRKGDRVNVLELARTQSGTTRARVSNGRGQEGWMTSTTKYTKGTDSMQHLLALPENEMLGASKPTESRDAVDPVKRPGGRTAGAGRYVRDGRYGTNNLEKFPEGGLVTLTSTEAIRKAPGNFAAQGTWSDGDEEALLELFKKFGQRWTEIAQEISGKSADQIAAHHYAAFNPSEKARQDGGWADASTDARKALREAEAPDLERCRQPPMKLRPNAQ